MDLEEEILICSHCEKKIRYERPLFCPYCGKELDAASGLTEDDSNMQIYPWARIVPALAWAWVAWAVLVLPSTLFFGRSAFAIVSIVFILITVFLIAGGIFQKKR